MALLGSGMCPERQNRPGNPHSGISPVQNIANRANVLGKRELVSGFVIRVAWLVLWGVRREAERDDGVVDSP